MSKERAIAHEFEGESLESAFIGRRDGESRPTVILIPTLAQAPTSTGYGASFRGLAALLGMLSSCAAGVTVVNIDNGFGAGYAAALINRGLPQARPGAPAEVRP